MIMSVHHKGNLGLQMFHKMQFVHTKSSHNTEILNAHQSSAYVRPIFYIKNHFHTNCFVTLFIRD